MTTVRILVPGDEPALARFAERHPHTTLFFQSNVLRAGLVDRGDRYHGTYAGAFERGEIVALASHIWLGNVLVEAPAHLAEVVATAVAASGRGVRGLVGPHAQVVAARDLLGLRDALARVDSKEDLFALELRHLQVPADLAEGRIRARHPRDGDVGLMVEWRVAFNVEALGAEDTPELRADLEARFRDPESWRHEWILEAEGVPVSLTAFNATVPACVQVAGVWTPPEHRSRGYARAAVAASLLEARAKGVTRSILFTGEENHAAKACYRRLGYELVGDYGVLLFEEEHEVEEPGELGQVPIEGPNR